MPDPNRRDEDEDIPSFEPLDDAVTGGATAQASSSSDDADDIPSFEPLAEQPPGVASRAPQTRAAAPNPNFSLGYSPEADETRFHTPIGDASVSPGAFASGAGRVLDTLSTNISGVPNLERLGAMFRQYMAGRKREEEAEMLRRRHPTATPETIERALGPRTTADTHQAQIQAETKQAREEHPGSFGLGAAAVTAPLMLAPTGAAAAGKAVQTGITGFPRLAALAGGATRAAVAAGETGALGATTAALEAEPGHRLEAAREAAGPSALFGVGGAFIATVPAVIAKGARVLSQMADEARLAAVGVSGRRQLANVAREVGGIPAAAHDIRRFGIGGRMGGLHKVIEDAQIVEDDAIEGFRQVSEGMRNYEMGLGRERARELAQQPIRRHVMYQEPRLPGTQAESPGALGLHQTQADAPGLRTLATEVDVPSARGADTILSGDVVETAADTLATRPGIRRPNLSEPSAAGPVAPGRQATQEVRNVLQAADRPRRELNPVARGSVGLRPVVDFYRAVAESYERQPGVPAQRLAAAARAEMAAWAEHAAIGAKFDDIVRLRSDQGNRINWNKQTPPTPEDEMAVASYGLVSQILDDAVAASGAPGLQRAWSDANRKFQRARRVGDAARAMVGGNMRPPVLKHVSAILAAGGLNAAGPAGAVLGLGLGEASRVFGAPLRATALEAASGIAGASERNMPRIREVTSKLGRIPATAVSAQEASQHFTRGRTDPEYRKRTLEEAEEQ